MIRETGLDRNRTDERITNDVFFFNILSADLSKLRNQMMQDASQYNGTMN